MCERAKYRRKGEARLANLEEDIDRLRNRIATPVVEIRERVEREILDLRSKAEEVRRRVRAVEGAGASDWGRLKNAVDDGLKDLGHGIDETIKKFRKTGSGGR